MCLFSGGFRQEEVAVAGRVSWQLLCPGRAGSAFGCPALIRAAMAGWVRSMSRQRPRSGPMRPMGMPSSALILASGTGGSPRRSVSSRWQPGGRWARASRNAVWRSANWSSCSGSCPAVAAVASGMFAACGVCPWACGRRAACKAGADSRAVAVASQAGSVAGGPEQSAQRAAPARRTTAPWLREDLSSLRAISRRTESCRWLRAAGDQATGQGGPQVRTPG